MCAPASPGAAVADQAAGELTVGGICKKFDDNPVLRDVSFAVNQGEFVTLLGPSGCGKTTLLRIIAGLEKADAGSVTLAGHPLDGLPAHRRPVNTVFQNYALFPHLTVFENVAFGLRSRKVAPPEINDRVNRVQRMLQIEEFAKRHPHQLSGGQKQRVALARALVNEPELLLLDEPMSALDAKLRAEVQIELRRLQRRLGTTFILVTHDQDEAMTVSDRILLMRDGQIVQSGPPQEIYERPVSRFVAEFLGSANLIPANSLNGVIHTELGLLTSRTAPRWNGNGGTLAIRPEHIVIHAERPTHNAVRGRVREMIYRGDHIDLFMEPGSLRVRTKPTLPVQVGDEIWLELTPQYLEALED